MIIWPRINLATTKTATHGTPIFLGSGFRLSAPADTTVRTLKVFVGAFNGGGLFRATLSDGSAAEYTSTAMSNIGNGPSGVYTLTYSANSSAQVITIEYTLFGQRGLDPNVTLQAATLSTANANNLPF